MDTMNPKPMVSPPPYKFAFFDSGLGGLTVLKPFLEAFPDAEFLYFGDLARLPYGNKTPEMIRRYLEEGLNLLAEQKPDAIIVACHSASTQVRESHWFNIPLFDVLRPIAEEAARLSHNGHIGVIATRATISQGLFSRWIRQLLPEAQVIEQACPLFVPLIEEGWIDDPITNLIAYRYLSPIREKGCDTLVLGCTHYPIIHNNLLKAMSPQKPQLVHAGPILVEKLKSFFHSPAKHAQTTQVKPKIPSYPAKTFQQGVLEKIINEQRLKILVSEIPSSTWVHLVRRILGSTHLPDINSIKPLPGH